MAWRFKASKYKNAAAIVPKAEACVREICVGSYQTYGNNIAASASFMAFNFEHTGSSLAVLPLDDCGRKSKSMPLLHGHTDTITDLMFSPFHDGLLATGSQDCLVKLWHIPEKGLEVSLSDPEAVFSHKQRRVETVGFHPTSDFLLYSTAAGCVTLFDISTQKEIFSNNEHPEVIQSTSWREDGTVMATSCKDKCVRIFDPRASNGPIQMVAESHQNIKDSRVVWLGNQPRILTTGFDVARVRQVMIRDLRNFSVPEKLLELDCSTGILMPLFDADTNMLFLAGKGDTTINYLEITDKDPYFIEGLRHTGEQTKGACLVPKRALKVMEAEVNRVLQLTSNMVIPIMYQVPRKTYRDFHADLYPDTTCYKTELIASEWLNGTNYSLPKMTLDPAKRLHGDEPIIIHRGNLSELVRNVENLKATRQCNTTKKAIPSPLSSQQQQQQSVMTTATTMALATATTVKRNDNEHFVLLRKCPTNFEEKNGNHNDNENGSGGGGGGGGVTTEGGGRFTQSELIRKFDNKFKQTETMMMMTTTTSNTITTTTATTPPIATNTINTTTNTNTINTDEKDSPTDGSTGSSEEASLTNSNSNSNSHLHSVVSGGSASGSSPPKPMPRTSRNNSLPESIGSDNGEPTTPRPRPRTTAASAYKPRLGPKPFSSTSGDVSFDKVFAVPVAPGSQENIPNMAGMTQEETTTTTTTTPPAVAAAAPVASSATKSDVFVKIEISKDQNNVVKDACDGFNNGTGNGVQKSLTTSERRKSSADDDESSSEKIFEQNSESSENSTEGDERLVDTKQGDLGSRDSVVRNSIAARRRAYESQSSRISTDEKSNSPAPLRRDSSEPLRPILQQQGINVANVIDNNKQQQHRNSVQETRGNGNGAFGGNANGSVVNNGGGGGGGASTGIKKPGETGGGFTGAGAAKRTSTVFGKVSKFRHLKGTPGHKSKHIENVRNLSRQIPGECNGFHANHERVAVPLSGPGGKIAIYELTRPGRLPDGVIPSLVNGNSIMDFQWDPFDDRRLAVACDDGIVKFWRIHDGGLKEPTNITEQELPAHSDKIYFIRFHPQAEGVLLTASYDMTVKLWNLHKMHEHCTTLIGHTDQIFDFAWSPCGKWGASVCKDGKIRVYNPRKSSAPIREGNGPVGTRGARITWALDSQYIVCTGFDKVSERQISVYNAQRLNAPLNTTSLDVSPSILIPFYDEDSSTLFVTGKGDSTIYCYEITDEEPYICPLSHHRCSSLHQGLSFLTKNHCDVASVEFSKAYRLTNTTIEPLSFTVPRIKNELFQDDLFPNTRVSWRPSLTADEWFSGVDKPIIKISLKPAGMESLSSIQQVAPPPAVKRGEQQHQQQQQFGGLKSDYELSKQQEIQKSVSARMEFTNKLEQDDMEGVDENEWHD